MVYLFALLALSVSTFLGFVFLRLLDQENKLMFQESLGLSYGLGLGIVAMIMTCLALGQIKFSIFNILVTFILILALLTGISKIFIKSKNKNPRINLARKKMSKGELFFLSFILLEVFAAFFVSMIKPIESYDAVAHWGVKAKIIYSLGGLPLDIFSRPSLYWVTFTGDYPWLLPFAQSYIYSFIGSFNDFAPKIIGPLFFAACLVVFYNILRRINLKRLPAIIFTFFLASIPHFNNYAATGYADLILGFYYSLGFLYLYLWFAEQKKIYLLLSAVFSALAGYVKCEGILLASINVITFLIFILSKGTENKKVIFKNFIFYIIILAALSAPMFLLKQITCANLSNHTVSFKAFSTIKLENLFRLPSIMYAYQKQFFNLRLWNFTWVLFFAGLFFLILRKVLFKKELKFLIVALGIIFLAYICIYVISPDVRQDLRTLNRLLLHFLPLVIFFIARVFALDDERRRQERFG